MEAYCDLHCHSCFSDGSDSPEELIKEAQRIGLAALALTDHNTVEGLPRFLKAGRESSVFPVPGIEFSTAYKSDELHIVALMAESGHFDEIRTFLADFQIRREKANRDLMEKLRSVGIMLDYDRMKASAPGGYINRSHIASELCKAGAADSPREAFKRYLTPESGFFTPARRPGALETIDFILSINAIPVLAHGFRSVSEDKLISFLSEAAPRGLVAMETLYSDYDEATCRRSEELADKFGLLRSGGSDYHGRKKPDIHIGTGRGSLAVPLSYLQALLSVRQTDGKWKKSK